MKFDGIIKHLGNVNITPMLESVHNITDSEWDADLAIPKSFPMTHGHTRMIKLYWVEDVNDGSTGKPTELMSKYPCVHQILDKLLKLYGGGRPSRVLFAKLRAGMSINKHKDTGGALVDSHRTHTPIVTNENIDFRIDGKRCKMDVGEIYEINNQLDHSVHNGGTTDRIHLIVDWNIPGEYHGQAS
jgi:hypothetical protein